MTDLERITVNLIPAASRALSATAELLELSRTDTVNRALQAYAFLENTVHSGGKVMVEQDGAVEVIKFL
jgi:hypothetical protein